MFTRCARSAAKVSGIAFKIFRIQGKLRNGAKKYAAAIVFANRCRYDARSLDRGERVPSVVTKSDLVHAAARAGNLSKSAAGDAVNAVFDAIVTSVAKGNRVTVVGFGTFLPRKRKARAGRSPANGKEIRINAKTVPAFAAGQGFKDAVGDR
jgi:DNA-binding protein HU-beta